MVVVLEDEDNFYFTRRQISRNLQGELPLMDLKQICPATLGFEQR